MGITAESQIVLDEDVLSETHAPSFKKEREQHLAELQKCVSPALRGQKPFTSWLHGAPGTGKTTVACHVLVQLCRQTNISGIYVNCWKHNSFYSVIEHILSEMWKGFGDARDKSVKLAQFERLVKDKPFLIVLDEVDLMPSRERNTMIYNLYSIGKVGLICISESRYPILSLESRIRSRLSPRTIAFEPYSTKEMKVILSDRAVRALHPESWSSRALELIAKKAQAMPGQPFRPSGMLPRMPTPRGPGRSLPPIYKRAFSLTSIAVL